MKQTLKRILSAAMALVMLCTLLPVSVLAAEEDYPTSGKCGDNVYWEFDETTGTLTISGEGEMWDFVVIPPWFGRRIVNAVLKNGVTSIGENTFFDCSSLKSVIIPDGVTSIGDAAFYECDSLTSVTIPDSVTSIGDAAFYDCDSLTSVLIPDSVTSIGNHAFEGCTGLTSVTIPENVTSIGRQAFYYCESLTSVTIPDSVARIGISAFAYCRSLQSVTIPDSVTSIERYTFSDCSSLKNVTIPNSVTSIGDSAFEDCNNLKDVYYIGTEGQWSEIKIGSNNESLTKLKPHFNFNALGNGKKYLEDLQITASDRYTGNQGDSFINRIGTRNSTTDIHGNQMSHGLEAWIARWNFKNEISWAWAEYGLNDKYSRLTGKLSISSDSYNLTTFDSTIEIIGDGNVLFSSPLTPNMEVVNVDVDITGVNTLRIYVYDNVASEGGTSFSLWDFAVSNGEDADTPPQTPSNSIPGLSLETTFENFYIFFGAPELYNMDSPDAPVYLTLGSENWDRDKLHSQDIVWGSSDESIFKVVSSGDPDNHSLGLVLEAVSTGIAMLTATGPDGSSLGVEVEVVKPNQTTFTQIYDTEYEYSGGGFFSEVSFLSDCVEIVIDFENKLPERFPIALDEEALKQNANIEPITLTATVNGTDLSFSRDTYQHTYTTTYQSIPYGESLFDILMLFPKDVSSYAPAYGGQSYEVNITLTSDSFAGPITQKLNFTVYDKTLERFAEHVELTQNNYYNVSKGNYYANAVIPLKHDKEYQWGRICNFDIENYYEVVLADIIIGALEVKQTNVDIVPKILEDWYGTYNTLLSGISVLAEESYDNYLDISETDIDKVLKISKYAEKDPSKFANDDIYKVAVDLFGTKNKGKIEALFTKMDNYDTGIKFGVDVGNDAIKTAVALGNSISVMNAYGKANEEFQTVLKDVANNIPDSERKMKEAIMDYVNYEADFWGAASEMTELILKSFTEASYDLTTNFLGSSFTKCGISHLSSWLGSMGVSSFLVGIKLGLCISDLLCKTGDLSSEMGKMIAMAEFTPYIIQTLNKYETEMFDKKTENSLKMFEEAFSVHKAAQCYMLDHAATALDIKGSTFVQWITGNSDDYFELASQTIGLRYAFGSLICCIKEPDNYTLVNRTKVIAIRCPVDVWLYSESGQEVMRIKDNAVEYISDGIEAFVFGAEKMIAVPNDQEYSVKIIATDEGTMDYVVVEFDENMEAQQVLQKIDIPLIVNQVFTGKIIKEHNEAAEKVALKTEDEVIVPEIVGIADVLTPDSEPDMPSISNPFTDVSESDWFYEPVLWAVDKKVTGGKTETTFAPYEGCTRAQVVTFLWAANGKPEPTTENPFTDVAEDAWFLKPVLWAVENGITTGVTATEFGPENTCTRAQIATFLWAANGKPAVSGKSEFVDVADGDWFATPIIWAKENDVTGGIGEGKFGPNDTCTRAQVVTFLKKVYANK